MKQISKACACALLLVTCIFSFAQAKEYAALEGKNVYVGGGLYFLNGDNASGSADSECLPGVHLLGFSQEWIWRAFVGNCPGDDELLVGGSLDYAFANNYEDAVTCGDNCSHQNCEFDLWWLAAGPSVIAYRNLYEERSGNSVDGEELGLNLSAGIINGKLAFDVALHFFPESESTLVSAGVATNF